MAQRKKNRDMIYFSYENNFYFQNIFSAHVRDRMFLFPSNMLTQKHVSEKNIGTPIPFN